MNRQFIACVIGLILALLLGSATAQISERRCESCTKAGLSISMWEIQPEPTLRDGRGNVVPSAFEGRIYLYFRNTGNIDWRLEWVNCHFSDSANNRLFSRSIDMEKLLVSRDTSNLRSDPYGLQTFVTRMKANCWIQDAVMSN